MKTRTRIICAALASAVVLMAAGVIGYQDWQLRGSAPGNPASGYLRMWADNTAGKFKCLTSGGTSCYFDLPNPSASTLGGVESLAAVSHDFLTSISTSGVPAQAQPAFSDLSGSATAGQLPNPTASTLGGIESYAAVSNQWINTISTSGVPSSTQPAFSNISGTATAGQIPASLSSTTSVNGTTIPSSVTLAQTIASGTKALGTSAIASATCATVATATATGTLTTDIVEASFNGDPTAVTGYVPLTTGMLTILVYPTADTFNAKVCNNTSASITPGALTVNWRVTR